MIKAVIFDFNGTLFWDTHYHAKAFDILIDRYLDNPECRSRKVSDEDKLKNIMGKQNDAIMPYIFGELTKDQINQLGYEKEAIYRELCKGKVELAPGIYELFDFLKKQNILFTIATSGEKENIDFYYEETPLSQWIPKDLVVYNDGTIAHGKPAPDIFIKAMNKLNASPEETLIFEDSNSGILAAERSGAKVIVVTPNVGAYNGPHLAIDNFIQAIPQINKGNDIL